MGAGEVDGFFFAIHHDLQRAALDDGLRQLADLVALGQVGIEVVLAVEHVDAVERGADGETKFDGAFHRALVQYRQHARQRDVDRGGMGVGRGAEGGAAAGKDLGLGGELGVDLQPDDGLPLHKWNLVRSEG